MEKIILCVFLAFCLIGCTASRYAYKDFNDLKIINPRTSHVDGVNIDDKVEIVNPVDGRADTLGSTRISYRGYNIISDKWTTGYMSKRHFKMQIIFAAADTVVIFLIKNNGITFTELDIFTTKGELVKTMEVAMEKVINISINESRREIKIVSNNSGIAKSDVQDDLLIFNYQVDPL